MVGDTIDFLIRDATEKWNDGLDVFFTSPYGIFVLFILLFWWLNRNRSV